MIRSEFINGSRIACKYMSRNRADRVLVTLYIALTLNVSLYIALTLNVSLYIALTLNVYYWGRFKTKRIIVGSTPEILVI